MEIVRCTDTEFCFRPNTRLYYKDIDTVENHRLFM